MQEEVRGHCLLIPQASRASVCASKHMNDENDKYVGFAKLRPVTTHSFRDLARIEIAHKWVWAPARVLMVDSTLTLSRLIKL